MIPFVRDINHYESHKLNICIYLDLKPQELQFHIQYYSYRPKTDTKNDKIVPNQKQKHKIVPN